MIFDEWFHKEYEPADLQIKQYAERNEGLHIPATIFLEDLKEAFEAGQKDKKAQIEKMKNWCNCKNYQQCLIELAEQGKGMKPSECCVNCKKWELDDYIARKKKRR